MKAALRTAFWLFLLIGLSGGVFSQAPTVTQVESPLVDERSYVGNIYGRVLDAVTAKPISRARLYVYDPDVIWAAVRQSRQSPRAEHGQSDPFEHPAFFAVTGREGKFLIPGVATPFPFRAYTIVALANGYSMEILDRVHVFPGASMALRADFSLDRGSSLPTLFHGDDPGAPYLYRHEEALYDHPFEHLLESQAPLSIPNFVGPFAGTVFATREGLVGGTTANGHVVVANDHFVALPSRRALSFNGGHEFEVEISFGARKAVMPQWDIGPWNIRDDYWNPWTVREKFQDLPQGMPEAQAAFQTNYNNGLDGGDTPSGPRQVRNPAGIDLADGTFLQDLQLPDNSFINVKFLWLVNYALASGTGQRLSSAATSPVLRTGSALMTPSNTQSSAGAFLTVSQSTEGTLIYETAVPQSPLIRRGLMRVDLGINTKTRVSLTNPSAQPANIELSLLGSDGTSGLPAGSGVIFFTQTLTLGARSQQTIPLTNLIQSQSPPVNFLGALLIQTTAPISAIGLRDRTNERGETITTTTPVVDDSPLGNQEVLGSNKAAAELEAASSALRTEEVRIFLPFVKDGMGYSMTLELINPFSRAIAGTVFLFDDTGSPLMLTLNGQSQSSFHYSLDPQASLQRISAGDSLSLGSGYAVILPDPGSTAPRGTALVALRQGGVSVSQAGLPAARPVKTFLAYIDRRSSRDSTVRIVNPGRAVVELQWTLTSLDGTENLASESVSLGPGAGLELVASTHFSNLPSEFEGILRVSSSDLVTAAALHSTTNTRGETLVSAAPLYPLATAAAESGNSPFSVLPYLSDGSGSQSELVLLNVDPQKQLAGTVNLFTSAGSTLNLNFQ